MTTLPRMPATCSVFVRRKGKPTTDLWKGTLAVADVGIVNVASVPQRSPFRYPGGKTWLVPCVRRWLVHAAPVSELIEPFAGGAIVSLTAVFENLTKRALLVERDPNVAAVWDTILNGAGPWLADRIGAFEFSPDNVRHVLTSQSQDARERAFATVIQNRVQRGGILAPGAGLMKEGENGRGLSSRWYPATLRKRILAIAESAHRITFIEGDGLNVMRRHANQKRTAFFIDPPYTIAGRRLYTYSDLDHEELFRLASTVAGQVLITYDYCHEICELAWRYGFETLLVPMKNTHHACKYELLIGKDLGWLHRLDALAASHECGPQIRAGSQGDLPSSLRQNAPML